MQRGMGAGGFRPEIQALRAFAVLAVVIYHLWPNRMPGGYVGVDIFFVVSGFLITGHLLREIETSGTVRVTHFWARRIRRLLPASLFVLVATSVAVWMFVPQGLWQQFFREIGASALYIENWALAADAVDYLAADNIASPVQHFWSLGVEEQLYAAWPLLLIGAAAVAIRQRGFLRQHLPVLVIAAAGVASLAYSSSAVLGGSQTAYFETHARVWEFAAGGLLAWFGTSERAGRHLRSAVSWLAWAGLVVVVLVYDDATPFPGVAAMAPVVLTIALIWAGSPSSRWSHSTLARWKPVQVVGDLSYSVYLWHWPLLVILPFATGRELRTMDKLFILVATIGLAFLSKRLIEDPARFSPGGVPLPRSRVFLRTATAMTVVLAVAGGTWGAMQAEIDRSRELAARYAADPPDCFGAESVVSACENPALDGLVVPAVQAAPDDAPAIYRDDCQARYDDDDVRHCRYGVPGGTRVALVGDSHAASWFPAVEALAEQRGWELHTFLMGSCPFTFAVIESNEPGHAEACAGWNQRVQRILAESETFEVVLTSHYAAQERFDGRRQAAIAGFRRAWEPLTARGTDVVVIRDVPILGKAGLHCLTVNATQPERCGFERERALLEDYAVAAAEGRASSIDMTGYICPEESCATRIGGALVYRDTHHLTGTYSRTLAPYLESELARVGAIGHGSHPARWSASAASASADHPVR